MRRLGPTSMKWLGVLANGLASPPGLNLTEAEEGLLTDASYRCLGCLFQHQATGRPTDPCGYLTYMTQLFGTFEFRAHKGTRCRPGQTAVGEECDSEGNTRQ